MEENSKALLYLIACALNHVVPDEKIYGDAEPEAVCKTAKNHSIVSLVASALELNDYKGIDPETKVCFEKGKFIAIYRDMLFEAERKEIFRFLDDEKIRYLPLKGIVLRELYPEHGMREMSDNDILYDIAGRRKLKNFMTGRGYTPKEVGTAVRDCYLKDKGLSFEMHTALYSVAVHDGMYADYFAHIWDKAIPDTKDGSGYHLRDEDLYIYILSHAEKHHHIVGTGIRVLADIFVLNKAFPDADRVYIRNELDKLDLTGFESCIRRIADRLLSDPDVYREGFPALTEEDLREFEYLMSSGTYGTVEHAVQYRMKKYDTGLDTIGSRFRYCLKRLFPRREELLHDFLLAKYRPLLPLVWVCRIVSGLTAKRKIVVAELKMIGKKK